MAFVAAPSSQDGFFVAGCNRGCRDCSLGAYKTYVIGVQHGTRAFPQAEPAAGYSCATHAAVGDTIRLVAHSPEEHLVIVAWETPSSTDYCPCVGTEAQTCEVRITDEVVQRYERVYCGAIWARPSRAIAR